MTQQRIYVKAAAQISIQQPLSEGWINDPVYATDGYKRSQDPNFRDWLPPLEARRMGKLMRRALVTALKVLRDTNETEPDAIITGTGLGCIENTELFLDQLCREGEEMLKPTYFMQSTHNTISSLIAIKTKCHGYNSTYSHKSISFDSALFDAFVQMRLGDICSAVVTGNDEMTPSYFKILQRTGYVGQPQQVTAGEASVAMLLTNEPKDALCEIRDMGITFGSIPNDLRNVKVDAVMMGYNGSKGNDDVYDRLKICMPRVPVLHYKHLFGECYTSSALGVYAISHLLCKGKCPSFMRYDGIDEPIDIKRILFVNHSDGQSFSYIILNKTGDAS
mgnify:FL=1